MKKENSLLKRLNELAEFCHAPKECLHTLHDYLSCGGDFAAICQFDFMMTMAQALQGEMSADDDDKRVELLTAAGRQWLTTARRYLKGEFEQTFGQQAAQGFLYSASASDTQKIFLERVDLMYELAHLLLKAAERTLLLTPHVNVGDLVQFISDLVQYRRLNPAPSREAEEEFRHAVPNFFKVQAHMAKPNVRGCRRLEQGCVVSPDVMETDMDEDLLPVHFSLDFSLSMPRVLNKFPCVTETDFLLYRWTFYTLMRAELLGPFTSAMKRSAVYRCEAETFEKSLFWMKVESLERSPVDFLHFKEYSLVVCFTCKAEEFDVNRINYDRVFYGTVHPCFDSPGSVGLSLMKASDVAFLSGPFYMLECPVFFAAYIASLSFMRSPTALTKVPICKQLLSTGLSSQPQYLNRPYNLIDLVRNNNRETVTFRPRTDRLRDFDLILDNSQALALEDLFKKEVAVIQGPPGTGKTFLTAKFVQMVVHNQATTNWKPVVILSFTNKALDELLSVVARQTSSSICRLGGGVSAKGEQFKKRIKINFRQLDEVNKKMSVQARIVCAGLEALKEATDSLLISAVSVDYLVDFFDLVFENKALPKETLSNLDGWVDVQLRHLLTSWVSGKISSNRLDVPLKPVETHPEDAASPVECRAMVLSDNALVLHEQRWVAYSKLRDSIREAIVSLKGDHAGMVVADNELHTLLVGRLTLLPPSKVRMIVTVLRRCISKDYINTVIKATERSQALQKKAVSIKEAASANTAMTSAIVGMTVTYAASHKALMEQLAPEVIVVEEASLSLEPLLVAGLNSSRLQHLVLVGDHQQLRPVVNYLPLSLQESRFNRSLMERLISAGHTYSQLSLQHRAHPEVYDVFRSCYKQHISDHPSTDQRPRLPFNEGRVIFFNQDDPENTEGGLERRINEHQIDVAIEIARYLLLSGVQASQLVILSPYAAQVRRISDELSNTMAQLQLDFSCEA
ncbi:MAG: hypothetical protein KVP17_000903 [Porospora cf. gigantea B]|uniref:uncharacterized protein n=1 Tax=Porospora cf. gigantea B TaxID=2853592 RepID=UPI003571AAF5|nr:MAG: hypothetical protein KVP17_000903 [Porospora cf. gigantea B]